MQTNYIFYIVQAWTVAFFAYPMPFGTVVIIVGFVLSFWIDKWRLFCRCGLKDDFNYGMTKISSKLFMTSVWIYAVGNFIFSYAFTSMISWPSVVSLTAATLFMIYLWLLPSEWEFLIQDHMVRYEVLSYHYCMRNNLFEHTYRNQNPASKLASAKTINRATNWFVAQEDVPMIQNLRNKVKK